MNKIKKLPANTRGRDFVCGDIHGSYSCVNAFMKGVNFDKSVDRLISVGDLIDRGPENEKCLMLLNEPWFHCVKGNHEELMDEYFKGVFPGTFYWPRNGGQWGTDYLRDSSATGVCIRGLVTDKLSNLPDLITVDLPNGGVYHVLHAELYSNRELSDEDLKDPKTFASISEVLTADGKCVSWGRVIFQRMHKKLLDEHEIRKIQRWAEFEKSYKIFGPKLGMIYSGHTVVKRVIQFYSQTNLDTMAYGSYDANPDIHCGLSVAEPIANRFWFANDREFKETAPIIFKKENNVT